MALDSETKFKIVYLLGYPGKVLIEGSTHYNSIVADRLENLNDPIEEEVERILKEIEDMRPRLINLSKKGNVKRIGDIELDTDRSSDYVYKEYKRLLRELACLLDIPYRCKAGQNFSVCL